MTLWGNVFLSDLTEEKSERNTTNTTTQVIILKAYSIYITREKVHV